MTTPMSKLGAAMKNTVLVFAVFAIVFKQSVAFTGEQRENYDCKETDAIQSSSFKEKYVPEKTDSGWNLTCTISWKKPDYDKVVYYVKLEVITEETGVTAWNFTSCEDTYRAANGNASTLLSIEEYTQVVPFTHDGLFQLAYGVTNADPLLASEVSNITIETPDCYEETGDREFCATQGVVSCSKPTDVELQEVEFSIDENIALFISWSPPIQVNNDTDLFAYRLSLDSDMGDLLMNDTIKHIDGIEKQNYTWKSSERTISNVTLTIIPYVNSSYGDILPGRNYSQLHTDFVAIMDTWKLIMTQLVALVVKATIIVTCGISITRQRRIKKRKKGLYVEQVLQERAVETEIAAVPLLKDKEIRHDQVIIEEKLGEGEFGVVHKGLVTGMKGRVGDVAVAIKTTKVGAFVEVKEDLLTEMQLVAELGDHENIVCLLACCSINEPYYLITEYMKYGDLLGFLRKCRQIDISEKDQIYSVGEIQQLIISRDVANGMAHIQEKRFYHGDLAARNILVGEGLTIKIADFGLAEDIYTRGYKRRASEQKIPVKWCSLETILNGICTSEGDAWSFGVLMYEIFTLGGTPYPGVAPRLLVSQLKNGYRMEQPATCPCEVYDLMKRCWQENPKKRPRFMSIAEELDNILMKKSDYVEFEAEHDLDFERLREIQGVGASSQNDDVTVLSRKGTEFAPILNEDREVDFGELQVSLKGIGKHEA